MIMLYDNESGEKLGEITSAQVQFLQNNLEEEWLEDQDYYISLDTLDLLADQGADEALLEVLRQGLRGRTEMEIRWLRS